jgi:DNA-binding LacI/PurR family transcriptional regulator
MTAGIAGCEVQTVVKFLRGGRIRPSNRQRILAAMKEVDWTPEITPTITPETSSEG